MTIKEFQELRGVRLGLFIVIALIAIIQAVQPLLPVEWTVAISGILAMLGAIKGLFPSTNGEVNIYNEAPKNE